MTCWLNDDRLKVGMKVTLKERPDILWQVKAVYEPVVESKVEQRWAVGGITY